MDTSIQADLTYFRSPLVDAAAAYATRQKIAEIIIE